MFKSWDDYTELEQAAITYSDMFKDVHGFRPRSMTANWTLKDYEDAFVILDNDFEIQQEADREQYLSAIAEFESNVADMIEMGAGDRETALRWIIDAFDEFDQSYIEADPHYMAFEMGFPSSYDWRKGEFISGQYNPITQEVV